MSYHIVKTKVYCCHAQERGWYFGLIHDRSCKEHKAASSPEQIEHDAMNGYYENGGLVEDIKKLIKATRK